MSTTTTDYVNLVSSVAGKHLVLRPTREEHDIQGRRLVHERSRVVKFSGGRSRMPSEWLEELRGCAAYGRDVWVEGEDGAPMPTHGVQVVDGSLGAAYRQTAREPVAGWDSMGARELREVIARGAVSDLPGAMHYEVTHRNRVQVVEAISKAVRVSRGETEEPEPASEPSGFAEGFVQPLPPDARGV